MKRIRSILAIILAVTLTLGLTVTSFAEPTQEELLAQYYAALEKMQENGTAPANPAVPALPTNIFNQGASDAYYSVIVNKYMSLPAAYRKLLEKNKIKIYCQKGNYSSYASSNGKVMLYESDWYEPGTEMYKYKAEHTIIHELAHQFDNIQKKKSKKYIYQIAPLSSDMIPLIELAATKEIIEYFDGGYSSDKLTSDAKHGPNEPFAVLSETYFLEPARLYEISPFLYDYANTFWAPYMQ